ncbi:MAG TPA: dephospho-CoA kinase [Solimonas sp.]|nr:dephospho-CoA kinase [Solimonas sp.]
MPRLTVGLTGGIASGKSMVADAFAALGAPVLDADQVAREVVAPGEPALVQIAARFGPQFVLPDGTLDRRALRTHVFADSAALRELEQITHPLIRRRLLHWRDSQAAPYCILSVAILLESGMRALVDRVLVVDVAPQTQLQRLCGRDRIDTDLAGQMLAAQASREQRLAAADDVLVNEGPPEVAGAAVRRLHEHYLELARTGEVRAAGLCLPNPIP